MAPRSSTSGPTNRPPVAAATWDARNNTPPNGTVVAVSRVRLVVLFGGRSAEHDVSCVTAAHVLRAIDPSRYDVTPIGISTDGEWALAEGAQRALAAGPQELPDRLDPNGPTTTPSTVLAATGAAEHTVVLPLLHGPLGEDGTVQGLLELADVPYVGAGVLGSALAMDKAMAKQVLAANGIPQARFRAFADHQRTPGLPGELAAELGLPCFVKPSNMGSSVGVSKAHDIEELRDAIEHALTYDEWVVVEEAVAGREIEVAVLGGTHPEASGAGRDRARCRVLRLRGQVRHRRRPAARAGAAHRGADRGGAGAGGARVPGAARRRARPRRLLLRGGRARVPVQRGQHDARVHADLDVPQVVAAPPVSATRS